MTEAIIIISNLLWPVPPTISRSLCEMQTTKRWIMMQLKCQFYAIQLRFCSGFWRGKRHSTMLLTVRCSGFVENMASSFFLFAVRSSSHPIFFVSAFCCSACTVPRASPVAHLMHKLYYRCFQSPRLPAWISLCVFYDFLNKILLCLV